MCYSKNFLLDQEKLKSWVKFTYFLDYIWRQCLIETSRHDEKTLNHKKLRKKFGYFSIIFLTLCNFHHILLMLR